MIISKYKIDKTFVLSESVAYKHVMEARGALGEGVRGSRDDPLLDDCQLTGT